MKNMDQLILGIESTCDETAAAVVRNGSEILSNIVASQADLHEVYGGVVPELACRRHIEVVIPIVDEALAKAGCTLEQIGGIAVAYGPGLIGALLVGLNTAKALSFATGKPLIGVNHIHAHLYAALMELETPPTFPCIGVIISGGHTALVKVEGPATYKLIGQTIDDALGEAFDKVAKMLQLPYPGGPQVEALALKGDPTRYAFRAGRVKEHPLAFSFSGLKTAVLYALKGTSNASVKSELELTPEEYPHVAASFQEAALGDLVDKVLKACELHGCKTVIFGGGVSNNKALRKKMAEREEGKGLELIWPRPFLTTDNAAMIAGLGSYLLKTEGPSSLSLHAETRIPFLK